MTFFYTENGATSQTKADAAEANAQFKTIIAKKSGTTVIEMVLPDLKPGSYSLATRYAFTYVKNNAFWEATAGTVSITKNENSKISGNYKASAGSGVSGVTTLEGKFTDIAIK